MKTKARKKEDLVALTEQLKNSKSAMVLSFSKLTVARDQEFRNELRETGANYGVVKNTLARLAVKGTPFEEATEHFTGVTSVAWTSDEPVALSKVISKYLKEHAQIFEFKTGIVEGRVVSFDEVKNIASLPSKEELIGKLLYLLNAPAQRFATVLNAIPRDLAVVVKQVSEREGELPAAQAEEAPKAEEAEETKAAETEAPADNAEPVEAEAASEEAVVEEAADASGDGEEPAASEESE